MGSGCHTGDAGDDSNHSEDKYHDADETVYHKEGVQTEPRPYLIDNISHHPPPCETSGNDADESDDIMVKTDVRHKEIESSEETDYKEQNQWI